jgi:hypothetical protein
MCTAAWLAWRPVESGIVVLRLIWNSRSSPSSVPINSVWLTMQNAPIFSSAHPEPLGAARSLCGCGQMRLRANALEGGNAAFCPERRGPTEQRCKA